MLGWAPVDAVPLCGVAGEGPFQFGTMYVAAKGVESKVLVMEPRQPMVLDSARRERLRGSPSLNDADRWILDQIRERQGDGFVLMLRGANDRGDRARR